MGDRAVLCKQYLRTVLQSHACWLCASLRESSMTFHPEMVLLGRSSSLLIMHMNVPASGST
jgi:hypothetical protein